MTPEELEDQASPPVESTGGYPFIPRVADPAANQLINIIMDHDDDIPDVVKTDLFGLISKANTYSFLDERMLRMCIESKNIIFNKIKSLMPQGDLTRELELILDNVEVYYLFRLSQGYKGNLAKAMNTSFNVNEFHRPNAEPEQNKVFGIGLGPKKSTY